MEQIKKVPEAALNIVTDFTALKLAEMIKSDFHRDYVRFDCDLDIEEMRETYKKLEKALKIDISKEIDDFYHKAISKATEAKKRLKGKTFIWGNTKMPAFKGISLLCSLEMKPLLVESNELLDDVIPYKDKIEALGSNPYISKVSNPEPMKEVFEELKPDYFIGRENPEELIKRNIKQLNFNRNMNGPGFETVLEVMNQLLSPEESLRGSQRMMRGGGHNMNEKLRQKMKRRS